MTLEPFSLSTNPALSSHSHAVLSGKYVDSFAVSGSAPRGNRTPDLFVRSEALYPLSYEGKCGLRLAKPLPPTIRSVVTAGIPIKRDPTYTLLLPGVANHFKLSQIRRFLFS